MRTERKARLICSRYQAAERQGSNESHVGEEVRARRERKEQNNIKEQVISSRREHNG